MTGLLEGKVAVITGGASGMGEATAETYVREGGRVVVADIQDEAGTALADRLGEGAVYVRTDVTDDAAIEGVVAAAVEKFGRLDVFFSNAGAGGDLSPLVDITREGLDKTFALNLHAHVIAHKFAGRQMQEQGTGGSIIVTSSTAGVQAGWAAPAYSIAKAGVLALVRNAALELGPAGIRSNAIIPGAVITPIMAGYMGIPAEQQAAYLDVLVERLADQQPAGRAGTPQDIANAALFLGSDLSSWITGVGLPVDGGATAATSVQTGPIAYAAAQEFLQG